MTGGTFAAADGTRLAYTEVGSGPPLLCLPGGPGRAAAYLEDLGGLSASHTLVLLDTRGTGGSDMPADARSFDAPTLAGDLDALRQHLGLDVADVLGHSAGGRVAMTWAADHPSAVAHLVLVTSYLTVGSEQQADRERVMRSRLAEPWYAEAAEAAEGMAYAPPAERTRLESLQRPFWYGEWTERAQAHAATADHQVNPRVASRFVAEDAAALRPRLHEVRAPVLAVGGGLDGLTPPACAQEVAQAFPNGELVLIEGAGHFPWVDHPARFSTAVAAFLAAGPLRAV